MDVYDDRMVFNTPGGMYDGTLIQNRDIYNVPSVRRNPVLADVSPRGSGLRKFASSPPNSTAIPNKTRFAKGSQMVHKGLG